jgi:hypothetical protein
MNGVRLVGLVGGLGSRLGEWSLGRVRCSAAGRAGSSSSKGWASGVSVGRPGWPGLSFEGEGWMRGFGVVG